MKLLAAILTKNAAPHIGACLATLQWTDGVIVIDSVSTDNTVQLATALGAQVYQHEFINFSIARNNALQRARELGAAWLLFIDADERVSPTLAQEILTVLPDSAAIGWWLPRYNHMWGHVMRGGGWYPDYQLRLLKVNCAHYDPDRQVHELAMLTGESAYLKEHLIHYNYSSLAHFRDKQRRYAEFEAQILYSKGIHAKPWTYFTMPLREFWRRYITLQGYRDGWRGLQLCSLMGWYMFWSYWTLRRLYAN